MAFVFRWVSKNSMNQGSVLAGYLGQSGTQVRNRHVPRVVMGPPMRSAPLVLQLVRCFTLIILSISNSTRYISDDSGALRSLCRLVLRGLTATPCIVRFSMKFYDCNDWF